MPSPQTAPGATIYAEISSQPDAWEALFPILTERKSAIDDFFNGVEHLLLTGCGSGLNAARFAAPFLQSRTGLPAQTFPAADVSLFPAAALPNGLQSAALLFSRSGKTTETLRALERLQATGICSIGITCEPDSPLAKSTDLAFVLNPVSEQAVATTRSLTGMILTAQWLTAMLTKDDLAVEHLKQLPELGRENLSEFERIGKLIGEREDLNKYAFVANGPLIGLAHEGQLKFKETTLLPADAYPMLDFRHGPQSAADSSLLLIALLSNEGQDLEAELLQDIRAKGATTWAIGDIVNQTARRHADFVTSLDADLQAFLGAALYMIPIQYAAYFRSRILGLNPDEPLGLPYWIEIKG
jgi:glucosamine--fructose-6-phosphate aminotransferase (isomerizing)